MQNPFQYYTLGPSTRRANASKEQRANLARLADHLASLPRDYHHFGMRNYRDRQPCGVVACAIGHGPAAGIGVSSPVAIGTKDYEPSSWEQYSAEHLVSWDTIDWVFLFSSAWASVDNTPQGAAARIRHWLAEGLPPEPATWTNGPWVRA